jgi:hypothetical protein
VSVYGGTALVLFSAVVIVPQIVAWRRNRAAAGAASS